MIFGGLDDLDLDGRLEFPRDYINLIENHGAFEFSSMIAVNDPDGIQLRLRELRDLFLERGVSEIPIGRDIFFPGATPEGISSVSVEKLIEWADTDSDMSLCWHASGSPDSWRVVVTDYKECYFFPWGVSGFLKFMVDEKASFPYRNNFGWPSLTYAIESI